MMLRCINMDGLEVNANRPAAEAMNNNHHVKRQPTILALSDDPGLVELLLKTCNRPWKVKVTDDSPPTFTWCPMVTAESW